MIFFTKIIYDTKIKQIKIGLTVRFLRIKLILQKG
jgi:hypothetical protein